MTNVGFSETQVILNKIRQLTGQGIKITSFNSKQDTPSHVKEAARKMLGQVSASYYTDARGLPELRQALAEKYEKENAMKLNPDTDIIITVGGKQAIATALLAVLNPGDEVIVENPAWVTFEPNVRIAGGIPVYIKTYEENEFKINIQDLQKLITPKTKMIILCNPNNPTGNVLEKSDLESIANVAKQHDLLVMVDECYEQFQYDGRKHTSMASLNGMRERTITIGTTSKIYNMFGWRIGWVISSAEIIKPTLAIHSHSVTCPTSFAQAGAVAALKADIVQGDVPLKEMIQNYQKQRDALIKGFLQIPDVTCVKPLGAYFAFPNFKKYGKTSAELCNYFIDEARIGSTPGSSFGSQGEGHLRFVFNSPEGEIASGMERIASALGKLKK
jgi:aspartate/methionine/tyrosine aminotransferase